MTSQSIHELLQHLPTSSLTTRALGALDYLAPGEWQNITRFEDMIQHETGEQDQAVITAVGNKALELYADESTGFQRAVHIYKLVDSGSTMAGMTSLVSKLAEDVSWLSFLGSVTPKSETTQAVDASLKLAAEIVAFCSTNGIPGDGIGDFVSSLATASKEDSMRLTAWLAFDCMLPLGPEFFEKVIESLDNAMDAIESSPLYQRIGSFLPGNGLGDHQILLKNAMNQSSSWISRFVSDRGLSQEGILQKVGGYLEGAEGKLDYAAAIFDMATNVFEHTGIQTVARRTIRRAYGEI